MFLIRRKSTLYDSHKILFPFDISSVNQTTWPHIQGIKDIINGNSI